MNQQRSATFDQVAALYDKARPSYPEILVDAVVELAQLSATSTILEIGSGTGKATLPFARRGYRIHCLEPGRNLAAVAAQNLEAFPTVTIEPVAFEDWPIQEAAFDLVMSAQAFHWVAPEVGYAKAARALKKTGSLALFWNLASDADDLVLRQLSKVHQTYAAWRLKPVAQQRQEEEQQLLQSGCFTNLVIKEFPWSIQYSTQQYLDLVKTQSDYLILPEDQQRQLADAIQEILLSCGGTLVKPYVTLLLVAQPV